MHWLAFEFKQLTDNMESVKLRNKAITLLAQAVRERRSGLQEHLEYEGKQKEPQKREQRKAKNRRLKELRRHFRYCLPQRRQT